MYLKQIDIRQFRNISRLELSPGPGVNVIYGGNAQGKTNFLEAVHCLLKGRSFRTSWERECLPADSEIPAGERIAVINGGIVADNVAHSLRYVLASRSKRLFYDNKPEQRLADYWSRSAVVTFTPDDLAVVKGAPGERRRFLDILAAQLQPEYITLLQKYNAALRRRNVLLRRAMSLKSVEDDLETWDTELSAVGAEIFRCRWGVVESLQEQSAPLYLRLSGGEALVIKYENFLSAEDELPLDDAASCYRDMLVGRREIDVERGSTSIGPQRDDLQLQVESLDSRSFSSQGQQRSVIVALRCAEASMLEQKHGHAPIVLLDDVLSELDSIHRGVLLEMLGVKHQVFLTTTDPDLVPGRILGVSRIFQAVAGVLNFRESTQNI